MTQFPEIETFRITAKPKALIVTLKDKSQREATQEEANHLITTSMRASLKSAEDLIYHQFTPWRYQIKPGYLYQIGGQSIIASTGHQGAIKFGHKLQKAGFSNNQIKEAIALIAGNKTHSLSQIVWKHLTEIHNPQT